MKKKSTKPSDPSISVQPTGPRSGSVSGSPTGAAPAADSTDRRIREALASDTAVEWVDLGSIDLAVPALRTDPDSARLEQLREIWRENPQAMEPLSAVKVDDRWLVYDGRLRYLSAQAERRATVPVKAGTVDSELLPTLALMANARHGLGLNRLELKDAVRSALQANKPLLKELLTGEVSAARVATIFRVSESTVSRVREELEAGQEKPKGPSKAKTRSSGQSGGKRKAKTGGAAPKVVAPIYEPADAASVAPDASAHEGPKENTEADNVTPPTLTDNEQSSLASELVKITHDLADLWNVPAEDVFAKANALVGAT